MAFLFRRALVLGRFQTPHVAHKQLIGTSLELANHTLVLVGSANESGTERNPFTADFRIQLINKMFPKAELRRNTYQGHLTVAPLADWTHEGDNSHEWGDWIMEGCKEQFYGRLPDVIVYGDDEDRRAWFRPEYRNKLHSLILPRDEQVDVSATKVRELMLRNRYTEWAELVPHELGSRHMFKKIRTELLNVPFYAMKAGEYNA